MTAELTDSEGTREDQAIAWLVRLHGDDADAEDWRAHEAWLAADPANGAAFARVEALWAELDDRADALKRGLDGEPAAVISLQARRARHRPAPTWRWAAAIAAIAVAAGGSLYAYRQAQPVTYQTAAGHTRTLALADGSRIVMNGASHLSVRYDRGARRVNLADAEADFDVVHDIARPFVITAGAERIAVLGTAFDVVSHDGALAVTVRRGLVAVGPAAPNGGLLAPMEVPAGSRYERRADGSSLVSQVDPAEAVAWRDGRIVARGEHLSELAEALSRAFPTRVEVRGSARDVTFTGVLVLDDENAVVRRLTTFLPLDADRSNGAIVLSSRR